MEHKEKYTAEKFTTITGQEKEAFVNQYIVSINLSPKGSTYTIVNNDLKYEAASEMNGSEFKLWMYLVGIADTDYEYAWAFSTADVCKKMGMAENTCRAAFQGLVEKSYIA